MQLAYIDDDGKKVPSQELPYWMRDFMSGSLIAVMFLVDGMIGTNGKTGPVPKLVEVYYIRGWKPLQPSSGYNSSNNFQKPPVNLDGPMPGAASMSRKSEGSSNEWRSEYSLENSQSIREAREHLHDIYADPDLPHGGFATFADPDENARHPPEIGSPNKKHKA